MNDHPRRAFKVGSIVWAIGLGVAFIVLGASVLLPSTKRARFDIRHGQGQPDDAAATLPATGPATQP